MDERAHEYLGRLRLSDKLQVNCGRLSTNNLSQGERKRVALMVAYLEDRPIYVFDEWAAEQEPQFREKFYREMLPELRKQGKAVVVITHDDRYFHLADRVIKFEYGQLARDPAIEASGVA